MLALCSQIRAKKKTNHARNDAGTKDSSLVACPVALQRAARSTRTHAHIHDGTICRADVRPMNHLSLRTIVVGP